MPIESFELVSVFPLSPEELYAAWLDSATHAAFTGAAAAIDPAVGGAYSAWDDYIQGFTRELEPGRRIVQSWRTTEFAPDDPDSLLELLLEPHPDGTRLTLRHSGIPEGQGARYESGWETEYFTPIRRWLEARAAAAGTKAPRKRAAAKKRIAPTKAKAAARKKPRTKVVKPARNSAARPARSAGTRRIKSARRAKRRR